MNFDPKLRPAIADIRKSYTRAGLRRADLVANPTEQFQKWLREAIDAQLPEPTAATLATADTGGRPSARVVLLKAVDERGLVFFTNYQSRKARELSANPQATLLFFWAELERQARVSGTVERASRQEAQTYFQSRPRGHQLGAWASAQSEVVASRAILEQRLDDVEQRYPGTVPLPPFWGGYLLKPEEFEFWQGRPDRLHDRFRYRKETDGRWLIERLSP